MQSSWEMEPTSKTAAKQANLPGIICNKEGQELGPAVMKDVTVVKHGKFNLFSILNMLTQGWKLGGDREILDIQGGCSY
jgi:hypothetical protein